MTLGAQKQQLASAQNAAAQPKCPGGGGGKRGGSPAPCLPPSSCATGADSSPSLGPILLLQGPPIASWAQRC